MKTNKMSFIVVTKYRSFVYNARPNMYVKRKESGPLGGAPSGSANVIPYLFDIIVIYFWTISKSILGTV